MKYLPLLFVGFSAMAAEQVLVPAGEFVMGCSKNDPECDIDEGPEGGVKVYVPAFKIDKQEVSVGEYRQCVEAGKCGKPFDYLRTHYCNYDAPGRDNYPQNCINWRNALDYCEWKGGRLAYEAEWEKAARAGSKAPYPWGYEHATCETAVYDPGTGNKPDTETDGCWRDLTWPRNSHEPNAWGLYDMVGGTSEWVMNWYEKDAYANIYAKGDIKGPAKGSKKAIKGGSWDEKQWAQRVSNRFAKPITGNPDLYGSNGIRCVTPVN